MADVRCPMCSKPNPADREVCQYCQARLKPLLPGENAPASNADDQDAGLADWLQSLQGTDAGASLPPGRQEPAADETDWLKSLMGQSGDFEDTGPDSNRREPYAPEETDWLSRIGGEPGSPAEPAADREQAPPTAAPASESASSDFDWLKGFSQETPGEDAAEEPLFSDGDLPDWLTGASKSSSAGDFPVGEPDWMKPADSSDAGHDAFGPLSDAALPNRLSEGETPSGDEQAEDEFDWLKAASDDPSMPEWMKPASQQSGAEQQAAQPAETDIPDWLSGMEEPSAEEMDWLKPAGSASSGAPAFTDAFDTDLPDWMMTDEPAVTPGVSASTQTDFEQTDFDSRVFNSTDTGAAESGAAEPGAAEPGAAEPGELPDWMMNLTGAAGDESPASSRPADEPEWLTGESLDWLASELHAGEAAPQGEEGQRGTPPFSASALEADLSWLGEMDAAAQSAPSAFQMEDSDFELPADDRAAFSPDKALPSWLSEAQEEAQSETAAGEEGEGGLKPTELPSWLQAMRPVGVVDSSDAEDVGSLLGAGPLAGLRGALPAEPDISQIQKPPTYSSRLEISDIHQTHVDLLQSLIASEDQPHPAPARPTITSLSLLRIAAATLLILSILLSMLTGIPQNGLPIFPAEVTAAAALVDNLPAGAPVLLAVDYQPGVSGEMDALTGAVLEHLIRKGAYVVLVSTVPTGPVQAEHLASVARSAKGLAFESPVNYANLGYISGGSSGLLGFAQAPKRMIPLDLRGQQVWNAAPLQRVTGLENFSLIVFATETPDTARAWIEQVRMQLQTPVPMIALVSAQAEPLVRPYADAHPTQLEGMASGLIGGAAYEGAAGQVGPASIYWGPFSFGMLVSGLLAFVVIFFNLVSARLARRKQSAGSEGKA